MPAFYSDGGILTKRGKKAAEELQAFVRRWLKKHARGCNGKTIRELEVIFHHAIGIHVALHVARLPLYRRESAELFKKKRKK